MNLEGGAVRSRHMLGSYEILETVGQGGMGIVYRAHDHMLGRTVALKVLRDDLRVQSHLVSRFQREARAVAALDHPNIVQVYSVGSIDNIPYIAMEFIEGHTLSDLIRDNKKLPWEEVLRIGEQIAQGLSAAHDKLIFHRDIKPGNILLNETGRAYLTDFGIAKVLNAETQLTVDGSRLGTPHYMAPERCEGRDAGALSDVYALGIVMYQALTGRLPFKAETPAELIEQILANQIHPVSHYANEVPMDVDRLIAWITEKDPRHRPANAQRLADAMQRILAGMPLDEAGPNLAGALAEFRDGMHTPTPAPPALHTPITTTTFERFEHLWATLRWRWSTLPLFVRLSLASLSAAGVSALIAWYTVGTPKGDPQQSLLAQPDGGNSRWSIEAAAGQRTPEGTGVAVTRYPLPGYTVAELAGGPGARVPSGLLYNENRATGQAWAMVSYESADGVPTLIQSPIPVDNADSLSLLPAMDQSAIATLVERRAGSEQPVRIWSLSGERTRLLAELIDPLRGVPLEIGVIEASPNALAAAIRAEAGNANAWQVGLFTRDSSGSWVFSHSITAPGGAIGAIRINRSGDAIAYTRSLGDGRSALYTAATADRGQAGGLLAEGAYRLPIACWTSAGGLLTIEDRGANGSWLVLRTVTDGNAASTVAPAHDAAALDDGRIAVLAPDRRGDLQIWALSARPAESATQYTFIDGGMRAASLTPLAGHSVAAIGLRGALYAVVDFSR